jgi:hypothetical protein
MSDIESIGPDPGAATADPAPPTDIDTANTAAPTTASPRRADLLMFKPVLIAFPDLDRWGCESSSCLFDEP